MRSTRRRGALLGATALAFGLVSGVSHAAPAEFDASTTDIRGSVTLITGDQVVVTGNGVGSIIPGPGRDEVAFQTINQQGHLFVLPDDTTRLLSSGRVDRRLFDVTELIASRYDDAHRDTVPLIITSAKAVTPVGIAKTQDLPAVNSFAAQTHKAQATSAWQALIADPSYRKIWLDGLRQPTLDRSVAQIGAPAAWQAGFTGTGVKVAVLDTGVDATHPDLVGRELSEQNFTSDPDNEDMVGHGTHVAATIASAGAKYRGVAPDAWVLDGKVCVTYGCAESWILSGMQWAASQLDSVNSVPAGRLLRVPVAVQQNPGADNGTVRKITVEVSFDDGGTWRRVPVVGDSALVFNPGAGFASLRASATDSKGNNSSLSVLRAYAIS